MSIINSFWLDPIPAQSPQNIQCDTLALAGRYEISSWLLKSASVESHFASAWTSGAYQQVISMWDSPVRYTIFNLSASSVPAATVTCSQSSACPCVLPQIRPASVFSSQSLDHFFPGQSGKSNVPRSGSN